MAWVYILKNTKNRYYIGSTANLDERIRHHFGNHTPSTKRLHITALAFAQEYETIAAARFVEKKLKGLKGKDYIEQILQDGFIKITPP